MRMVYKRFVEEALSIALGVLGSCGSHELLEEALSSLRGFIRGDLGVEYVYEAVELLREAAYAFRYMGCLDWYRLEEAAGILEQALA